MKTIYSISTLFFIGIICLVNLQLYAQTTPATFVRFSYDGTTDCSNEVSVADSIASYVVNPPAPQMNRVLINCVQTTSTNHRFNSKDWSQLATYADYIADPTNNTYAYFAFQLTSTYVFDPSTGVDLMWAQKRSGNGPHQGFIRYQFYTSSNVGSGWTDLAAWLLSNSTVYDEKFHIVPPSALYNKLEIQFHGFDQKSTAGNGDALWFDDVRVVGVPYDPPVPVQLVSFTASVVNQSVSLKWNTATEVNNYGFEVQRSAKGNDWKPIAFIQGHGTVNTPQSYSYRDENIGRLGTSFMYRLKQINRDGSFEYSPVINAVFKTGMKDFGFISANPNPFNPSTMLSFNVPIAAPVSLKIYNVLGNVVATILNEEQLSSGMHTYMFEASQLASGTYYAWLTSGEIKSVYKVTLAR